MEGFAKGYYDYSGYDLRPLIPELRYRLQDQLCFKGKKVDYNDFTMVVKRGSSYVPLVTLANQPKPEEIVLDFSPLLNAGLAEFLAILSNEENPVDVHFLSWCQEVDFVDDWYSMLERLSQLMDIDILSSSYPVAMIESLKSSLIDYRFPTIKRIYSTLSALRWINPKSYCFAVLEAMNVAFSAIAMCMNEECTVSGMESNSNDGNVNAYKSAMLTKLFRYGALEYTIPGKDVKRSISDGRGLAMSATALFIMDLYVRFCGNAGQSIIPYREPQMREAVVRRFDACLGSDYIGRLLKVGKCRVLQVIEPVYNMALEANFRAVDCNTLVKHEGYEMGRGMYEAHLMWRHAVGAEQIKSTSIVGPVSCLYGTRLDIIRECILFAFSEHGMHMTKDILRKQYDEVLTDVLEQVDADKMLDGFRQEVWKTANASVEEYKAQLRTEAEDAEVWRVRAEAAEKQVAEKSDIIEQLRSEVASLEAKVRSTYSDEDSLDDQGVVDEPEVEVPIEEMLAYINQFRLVVVGGYDTMHQKLEAAGLKDVYVIPTERIGKSTFASGDFFCVCTKFVSHKLVFQVEKNYSNQLDQFFYFNGTNVDAFIRTCYSFMQSWMEQDS